jgi:predicted transcriptional regulator
MSNTNTGNQGNIHTGSSGGHEKFVTFFEEAIMQFVILNKAQQGEVTKESLQNVFKGNLQVSGNHFDHCLQVLVQSGHLKNNGNKYTITDDGREDVQKVQNLVIELPQIVNQGGQQQKQGITQQRTSSGGNVGGSTTGNLGTGNMGTSGQTGSNVSGTRGNVGGSNTNPGQPKGGQGGY